MEPAHTIHGPAWSDARERVESTDDANLRGILSRIFMHVESGWKHVADLQRYCEANSSGEKAQDSSAALLIFVDADLVDVFRQIALGVAELVPGRPGWKDAADPGVVDGDAELFNRYLTVMRLAVESAAVPEQLRVLTRAAAREMSGWSDELSGLLDAYEAAYNP